MKFVHDDREIVKKDPNNLRAFFHKRVSDKYKIAMRNCLQKEPKFFIGINNKDNFKKNTKKSKKEDQVTGDYYIDENDEVCYHDDPNDNKFDFKGITNQNFFKIYHPDNTEESKFLNSTILDQTNTGNNKSKNFDFWMKKRKAKPSTGPNKSELNVLQRIKKNKIKENIKAIRKTINIKTKTTADRFSGTDLSPESKQRNRYNGYIRLTEREVGGGISSGLHARKPEKPCAASKKMNKTFSHFHKSGQNFNNKKDFGEKSENFRVRATSVGVNKVALRPKSICEAPSRSIIQTRSEIPRQKITINSLVIPHINTTPIRHIVARPIIKGQKALKTGLDEKVSKKKEIAKEIDLNMHTQKRINERKKHHGSPTKDYGYTSFQKKVNHQKVELNQSEADTSRSNTSVIHVKSNYKKYKIKIGMTPKKEQINKIGAIQLKIRQNKFKKGKTFDGHSCKSDILDPFIETKIPKNTIKAKNFDIESPSPTISKKRNQIIKLPGKDFSNTPTDEEKPDTNPKTKPVGKVANPNISRGSRRRHTVTLGIEGMKDQ